MAYNLSSLKSAGERITTWLSGEFSTMRAGRATPALIENVIVEAYGARSPLTSVASIGVLDARTMRVQPWDTSIIKDIEKALVASSLGGQVIVDGTAVRVSLPELTEERRKSLIKLAHEKLEEAKVSLRGERDAALKGIRDSGMSDDEIARAKDAMEKIITDIERKFENMEARKRDEIAE